MTDEKLLEEYGWTVECQSPYEIRHEDGSLATQQAARMVTQAVREDYDAGGDEQIAGSGRMTPESIADRILERLSQDSIWAVAFGRLDGYKETLRAEIIDAIVR